jgi:hypothetical protein
LVPVPEYLEKEMDILKNVGLLQILKMRIKTQDDRASGKIKKR